MKGRVGERLSRVLDLTRSYRFQSLLVRNAVISFVLVLIPLFVAGLLAFRSIDRSVRSAINELNAATSLRVRDTIDAAVRDTNRMAASLVLEHDIWAYLRGIATDRPAFQVEANIRTLITRFANVYPYIDSIYVYSESTGNVLAAGGTWSFEQFNDVGWAGHYYSGSTSRLHLVSRTKFGVYPHLITAIRREFSTDGTRLGAVLFNLDVELLARIISASDVAGVQDAFVVGDDNVVLLHHDRAIIGVEVSELPLFENLDISANDRTVTRTVDSTSYSVSWARSRYGPLTYVVSLPLDMQIHRLGATRLYLVTAIVVSLIAAAIVAVFVSIVSYEPVSDVVRLVNDPDNHLGRGRERSGEVRFIAEQLTSVIHSNRRLRAEVETRLGLLHEAQIAALQAQINPHFLYNALEGINWLAIRTIGGENDVSGAVTDLSDLLRYSLGSDQQLVQLHEEIAHARSYLSVMGVRYPKRWVTEWNVAPDAEACLVPRVILQPILENAIQHGIVPLTRRGTIEVFGRRSDDRVHLAVADDGVGLSQTELDRVTIGLDGPANLDGHQIGLKNVHHRIRLLYSDSFGVRLELNPNGGLIIRIELPAVQQSPP